MPLSRFARCLIDSSISASLITGGATILAALIGVVGVALIFRRRRTVIKLCREIEAYHAQEVGWPPSCFKLKIKNTQALIRLNTGVESTVMMRTLGQYRP